MAKHRNNRLMIILFGTAATSFLFRFINSETNNFLSVTGLALAVDGLKNLFSMNEGTSGGWMVLAAFVLALTGCGLNIFLRNTSEPVNSLISALAYLNLFSFRTQKMHGFSEESSDSPDMHFGWAYWLALILLLIIVIQQVHRFIRWQHSSHVQINDGDPF